MDRRSQADAGTWTLLGAAIFVALFLVWLTDPVGQKWLAKYHEALARSHVNSEETNIDGIRWGAEVP